MDWNGLRIEFPVTRQWAYFDHAAVAPISGRAQQAMRVWSADIAEHGDVHEPRWARRIEEVRRLAGALIHADPLDVAFIKNTSEGIGIVAEGFPWQPGDNVVTAAEEYPANIYPWMNLATRGVELRFVPTREGRIEVDDIRDHIDARTCIVSLSAVEYASGFRNDWDAIGQLCRERGVLFFVDAIQALGVLPIDVAASPIDFLAADGHKWMLGPEGAGIFYVRRNLVERLHAVGVGWNSVKGARQFNHIDFTLKPHAGRWESGTLNVAGITALGASLELLLNIGIDSVAERTFELTDYFCEQIRRLGLKVYSSRQPRDKSAIVSLEWPAGNPGALVRSCRLAGIVVNHRAGRLRLSPHCYNNEEEIDRFLQVLKARLRPQRTDVIA
jgi:selenocysteine lyase/cysteine desulfurase